MTQDLNMIKFFQQFISKLELAGMLQCFFFGMP